MERRKKLCSSCGSRSRSRRPLDRKLHGHRAAGLWLPRLKTPFGRTTFYLLRKHNTLPFSFQSKNYLGTHACDQAAAYDHKYTYMRLILPLHTILKHGSVLQSFGVEGNHLPAPKHLADYAVSKMADSSKRLAQRICTAACEPLFACI